MTTKKPPAKKDTHDRAGDRLARQIRGTKAVARGARPAPTPAPSASTQLTFDDVDAPVEYGKNAHQRPALYEEIRPVVLEADENGFVSKWKLCASATNHMLRSAAAAYGYRVNISKDTTGRRVFRLNGHLPSWEAARETVDADSSEVSR